jgi:threonine/homoserine/homoserine lactone efflux protein
MDESGLWLTPLVLLPGVALLVLSTSVRYGRIHEEFHHLLESIDDSARVEGEQLWRRAALFRGALVGLYVSVCTLALGSMLGGLASLWLNESAWIVQVLTILGVLALVYSSVQLIRESILSLEVFRGHLRKLAGNR